MGICLKKVPFFDHQDSNARINIHHFYIEIFSPSRDVSLENLMEDWKLVVEGILSSTY